MKQVGFFGSFDKKDLLLNMAKILANLGKRVLIVDATVTQRLRYMVPNVSRNNSMTYVSEYLGIDVALGFMNLGQIASYLGANQLQYDIVMIDSDNIQTMASFMFPNMQRVFLVTSYDQFEVNRAMEILKNVNQQINITKVLISADLSTSQANYLDYELKQTNVAIDKIVVQFADTNIDRKAMLQNQLVKEIKFKHYSNTYKDSLEYITSITADDIVTQSEIRRMIKKMS